jgi:hypothetical protein
MTGIQATAWFESSFNRPRRTPTERGGDFGIPTADCLPLPRIDEATSGWSVCGSFRHATALPSQVQHILFINLPHALALAAL